ncbi:MAG: hypothetical protein LLF83_02385 [Methanobacterium sp.]|nr:hypothetical protein [Methanobacterium sp.]
MNMLRNFLDLMKRIFLKISFNISRLFNEPKIKANQEKLLEKNYNKKNNILIIVLTSGYDMVHGGILSISSIYEETKKIGETYGAQTVLCSLPGEPLLLKYTKFKNKNYIFNFPLLLSYFNDLDCLIIHIPEYACGQFLKKISDKEYSILDNIDNLHINIMIQNIDVFNDNFIEIQKLKKRFPEVTGTTAHQNYSNIKNRQKFGFPLHKLSTYVSPDQYDYKNYSNKEELIIVSNDKHPQRSEVLKMLQKKLPHLKIKIIKDMTYDEFKNIISKAKWALTFGEGLDGYFIEPIFSGAISFSVYNHRFFTKDFESLDTVYENYDELIKKMPSDLKRLDNKSAYENYQKQQFNLCSKYYDHKEYIENLKLFYKGDYTYK